MTVSNLEFAATFALAFLAGLAMLALIWIALIVVRVIRSADREVRRSWDLPDRGDE